MTTREVILDGGSPWGFRMHGGVDVHQPLRISRVNPGSKASLKGIREGDLITTINGQSTKDITNSEGHTLLKSAGDKLKLGLNEDCNGSPKRRQHKSLVLETVKQNTSSFSTTYSTSSQEQFETSPKTTDTSREVVTANGFHLKNGEFRENCSGLISEKSTLSSNGSTSSPTNSSDTRGAATSAAIMADNPVNKNKKRRRSNRKRSKKNKNGLVRECDNETAANYRVESPKTVQECAAKSKTGTGTVVKSRSLDSEEMLRITEMSESSESEEKNDCCNAIVAEVDSDIEWEITEDLQIAAQENQQVPHLSPEDETNLRNFLESIDLVSSPIQCVTRIVDRSSPESIRSKRAKKQKELAQYFIPVYQNPRYLDAISEESSDLSDKDTKEKSNNNTCVKIFSTARCKPAQKPLLPSSDIINSPVMEEGLCSIKTIKSSNAEVVHLDDSSSPETDFEENPDINVEERQAILSENAISESLPATQLTPPPTPDSSTYESDERNEETAFNISDSIKFEDSFRKEFKEVLEVGENVENLTMTKCISENNNALRGCSSESTENNVATTRCSSESAESTESSSVGTTQCTAKYNPLISSSMGEVNSILKEIEALKPTNEPLTLKEICLKLFVSLPFGRDVLEELAEVSQSLEEFTNNLPKLSFHLPNNQKTIHSSETTNKFFTLPAQMLEKGWSGLPTEEDPKTLICLSPTQREFLDSKKQTAHEADNLLDLHKKFILRRSHNEQTIEKTTNENVVITCIEKTTTDSSNNKLLDIIRKNKNGSIEEGEASVYEKNINNKSATLPRVQELAQEARLRARNLSEWLQLARSNVSAKSITHATNSFIQNAPHRRRSLPHEVHIRQMQYLIEKEKEIQRELAQLEEEKRKLTTDMYDSVPVPIRQFEPDDYSISRKGDIAIYNDKKPVDLEANDKFRQDMYNEYMDKVAERQERKHHKVIKISLHNNEDIERDDKNHAKDLVNVNEIENEFMNKVKERMNKFGLRRDDSREKSDQEDDKKSPVFVMDGSSITKTNKLPKHLQEFVHIAHQPEDGNEKKCKEARRIFKALKRNRHQDKRSLLYEIDANLVLARGFLLGRARARANSAEVCNTPEIRQHYKRQ